MVGNDLELEIIGLFSKDITALLSINQIAAALKKKYPYINKKVTQMLDAGIFRKQIIGRSYLCSINLANDEAIILLTLLEIRKKKEFLRNNPESPKLLSFIDENKDELLAVIVIEKEAVIVIKNNSRLKHQKAKVITKKDFLQLLTEKEDAQSNHVILYSFEKYYECLREVEPKLRLKKSTLL